MVSTKKYPALDFFAGSGLVSEGLGEWFVPVWANDHCRKKAAVYCANHPRQIFHLGCIKDVRGDALPPTVLSWGSFPCQDLSLAGNMGGISSSRSGLVWQWLRVMDEMSERPPVLVAENVVGLVSAAKGIHYRELHQALIERGYSVGAVVLDAIKWLPQSRKRVFVVAVDKSVDCSVLKANGPSWCHTRSVVEASKGLDNWVWWSLAEPIAQTESLDSVYDTTAASDARQKTEHLLALVPPSHLRRLEEATANGHRVIPGYRRVRNGKQVLELRFDGIAGCLRTPDGGSSRQILITRENGRYKTRLLTVREAAALMGAPATYKIPGSYNDGYRAMGDAVAVPVVRYLAKNLLYPIARITLKKLLRNEPRETQSICESEPLQR